VQDVRLIKHDFASERADVVGSNRPAVENWSGHGGSVQLWADGAIMRWNN
jgi:hypothetical protein